MFFRSGRLSYLPICHVSIMSSDLIEADLIALRRWLRDKSLGVDIHVIFSNLDSGRG